MKTAQNNTWMRYFKLGVLISIITMSFFSCKKRIYPIQLAKYQFINKTSHNIVYEAGFEKYNILPNSEVIVDQTQDGSGKLSKLEDFQSPFVNEYNFKSSLKIKYDIKCSVFTNYDGENNPLNIKNYISERIGDYSYKFTYTFTETDYNRAVICP